MQKQVSTIGEQIQAVHTRPSRYAERAVGLKRALFAPLGPIVDYLGPRSHSVLEAKIASGKKVKTVPVGAFSYETVQGYGSIIIGSSAFRMTIKMLEGSAGIPSRNYPEEITSEHLALAAATEHLHAMRPVVVYEGEAEEVAAFLYEFSSKNPSNAALVSGLASGAFVRNEPGTAHYSDGLLRSRGWQQGVE